MQIKHVLIARIAIWLAIKVLLCLLALAGTCIAIRIIVKIAAWLATRFAIKRIAIR